MTQGDTWQPGETVDLTNCDREPIHIPGSIQPHGVLIALREPELIIEQISASCSEHFGLSAQQLLGQPLDLLISSEEITQFRAIIAQQTLEAAPQYLPPVVFGTKGMRYARIVHRYQGTLILECEPDLGDAATSDLFIAVRSAMSQLNAAHDLNSFCKIAADYIREFTGFDRVMIYKFLEDGSGRVVAEALSAGLESYLGLHYPASDIPKQARALYLKSWLRFMVDVTATPAALLPQLNPTSNAPLDLSYAVLRSMSPIHVEYLKNIGATASLSISIIKDNALWGLIACHHQHGPRFIPHNARMSCEFLAHMISVQIGAKEDGELHNAIAQTSSQHNQLINQLARAKNYRKALRDALPQIRDLISSPGAAVVTGNDVVLFGTTPSLDQVRALTNWLIAEHDQSIFAADNLSEVYSQGTAFAKTGSGVMALRVASTPQVYILWFRPEETQTVNWAGNPNKPVSIGEHGAQLNPRSSFALWQEHVSGRSRPWQEWEVGVVEQLQRAISDVIVQRADELTALNLELERSNAELDSFAYVASHDLKEPLRGIHNYSQFLLEDYEGLLDGSGVEKLQTLVRLTQRMDALIESLLHYSRVGRLELDFKATDLDHLLDEELMGIQIPASFEIRRPRQLPTANVDPIRVGELFTNLVSNAIKYNDKSAPWIEISYLDETPPVFYVRDNGIGIPTKHFEAIFRIFKRLHARTAYGGGVGAGLTIVKKIVERHNGRIWVESEPHKGTTIYFTLQ